MSLRLSDERTDLLHTLLDRYCRYLNNMSTDELKKIAKGKETTLKDTILENIRAIAIGTEDI